MVGTLRKLRHSEFSDEEQRLIVEYVAALTKGQLKEFLRASDEKLSGTKAELVDRVNEMLDEGETSYAELVALLDNVEPWSRQHVLFYDGPSHDISSWTDPEQFKALLQREKLAHFLNARRSVALPATMKLSAIEHDESRLRVLAVQRRDVWLRDEDADPPEPQDDNIELRAYRHKVIRALVSFEWTFASNSALLHISQLSSQRDYLSTIDAFKKLVDSWIPFKTFSLFDVRPAVSTFHELEEQGAAETDSRGVAFAIDGRLVEGRSSSKDDPLRGDGTVDKALSDVRRQAEGWRGNFYFINAAHVRDCAITAGERVHVYIGGDPPQVNFPTNNEEGVIRYVLQRVRKAASKTR